MFARKFRVVNDVRVLQLNENDFGSYTEIGILYRQGQEKKAFLVSRPRPRNSIVKIINLSKRALIVGGDKELKASNGIHIFPNGEFIFQNFEGSIYAIFEDIGGENE